MKADKVDKNDDENFSKMTDAEKKNEDNQGEGADEEDGKVQKYTSNLWFMMDLAVVVPSVALVPVYATLIHYRTHLTMAGKECVANLVEYHPLRYQRQSELEEAMRQPGAVNVSREFESILQLGLAVNVAFLVYFFLKRPLCAASGRGRPCVGLLPLLFLASAVQFLWMIFMRHFSFPGRVCAGDFKSFLRDANGERDPQYDDYYLPRLGKFFALYPELVLGPIVSLCVGGMVLLWLCDRLGANRLSKPVDFEEKKQMWMEYAREQAEETFEEKKKEFDDGENGLFNKHQQYRDMAQQLVDAGMNGGNLDEISKNLQATIAEDLKKVSGFDYAGQFQEKMEKLNEMALRNPELSKKLEGLMNDNTEKLDEFLEQHPELKGQLGGNFKDLQTTMLTEIQKLEEQGMNVLSEGAHQLQDKAQKEIEHAQKMAPMASMAMQSKLNKNIEHYKDEAKEVMKNTAVEAGTFLIESDTTAKILKDEAVKLKEKVNEEADFLRDQADAAGVTSQRKRKSTNK